MTVISPPPTRQRMTDAQGNLDREWVSHLEAIWKRTAKLSVTTTGAVPANSRKDITVTWQPAFQDLNFSVSLAMEDTSPAGVGLKIERIRKRNAGNVVVQVVNDSASALTGQIHLMAVHD